MKRLLKMSLSAVFLVTVFASGAPAQISSLGANGLILDPYVQTFVSPGALPTPGCHVQAVPIAEVAKRCGDDDGCTMRIVSDVDAGLFRASTPPVAFVMDAIGERWSQALGDNVQSEEHMNGDATGNDLLVAQHTASVNDAPCVLRDDNGLGTPPDLGLLVCHFTSQDVPATERSCTLRIDD